MSLLIYTTTNKFELLENIITRNNDYAINFQKSLGTSVESIVVYDGALNGRLSDFNNLLEMKVNQGLNKCINKVISYTNFSFDWYLRIDDTDSIVFPKKNQKISLSKDIELYPLVKEINKNNRKFCTVVDYQIREFIKTIKHLPKGVIPSPDGAGVIISSNFLEKIVPFPQNTRYGDDIWLWFHFLKWYEASSSKLLKNLVYEYKLTTMSFEKSERIIERYNLLREIKEKP